MDKYLVLMKLMLSSSKVASHGLLNLVSIDGYRAIYSVLSCSRGMAAQLPRQSRSQHQRWTGRAKAGYVRK